MFKHEGSLDVDEVHSTSDGSIVYTYIHLRVRSSRFTVMKCMEHMNECHGFILSEIFGYDSVGSDDQVGGVPLTEHIAYRMICEHMKSNNAAFKSCTDGVTGVKRGILLQFDGFAGIRGLVSQRSKRLLPFLDNMENELNTTKRQLDEEANRTHLLMEENAQLKNENEELRHRNIDLEVKIIVGEHQREIDHMVQTALASFGT